MQYCQQQHGDTDQRGCMGSPRPRSSWIQRKHPQKSRTLYDKGLLFVSSRMIHVLTHRFTPTHPNTNRSRRKMPSSSCTRIEAPHTQAKHLILHCWAPGEVHEQAAGSRGCLLLAVNNKHIPDEMEHTRWNQFVLPSCNTKPCAPWLLHCREELANYFQTEAKHCLTWSGL